MNYTIVYDENGKFAYVQATNPDGSPSMQFGPGTQPWADYVQKNGVPPATGTPSFTPTPVPQAAKNALGVLKAYYVSAPGASTGISAQQDAFNRAVLVALQQLFQFMN